jgi:hypothetical protein
MPNTTTDTDDLYLNEKAELEALLGNPPTWMMRFGVWAVASFVGLLFCLAWFIKYPDVANSFPFAKKCKA